MLYTCFRCNWKLVRMSVVCHLLLTLPTTYTLILRRQTPWSCIVIRMILAGNTSLKLSQYRDVPICTQPWFAVEVGTGSCFSCSSPSLPRSYQNDQLLAGVSSISRPSLRRTGGPYYDSVEAFQRLLLTPTFLIHLLWMSGLSLLSVVAMMDLLLKLVFVSCNLGVKYATDATPPQTTIAR